MKKSSEAIFLNARAEEALADIPPSQPSICTKMTLLGIFCYTVAMKPKLRVKIALAGVLVVIAVVVAILGLAAITRVENSSIDCDKIRQESQEFEKRGVASNFAPEVIEKCFLD